MDATVDCRPRPRSFSLPERGGAVAALELGPEERPIDIVFSHANGFNARTYRTILGPLASTLRILALDLRGHGATTLPADAATFPGWHVFAEDLAAVLDQAAAGPAVLAGHSLGATVSLLCAAAAPQRARGLVLFEPVMAGPQWIGITALREAMAATARRRRDTFPDRAAAIDAYRGRGAFQRFTEAQLDDYVADGLQQTAEGQMTLACSPAWEAAIYARQDYDPLAAVAAVRRPVRILASPQAASSIGAGARAFAQAAGARLEVVPQTTHFLPFERPDLVREALLEAAL